MFVIQLKSITKADSYSFRLENYRKWCTRDIRSTEYKQNKKAS